MKDREFIRIDKPVRGHIDVTLGYEIEEIGDGMEEEFFNIADWYARKFGAYCEDSHIGSFGKLDGFEGDVQFTNFASSTDAEDFATCVAEATGNLMWREDIEIVMELGW